MDISFQCDSHHGIRAAGHSVIEAQGSKVALRRVRFSDCASDDGPAALLAYAGAAVDVHHGIFYHLRGGGEGGGAVRLVGATFRATDVLFRRCRAASGGAIHLNSIDAFPAQPLPSRIELVRCRYVDLYRNEISIF